MTFLYDIGRVLLDFDFESSLKRLLPPDEADPTGRLTRLLDRKDEFESGAIHMDDYTTWALEVLGINVTSAEFHDAWQQIFTPNEPMWERVRNLKAAGHRLILFSNTNAIHCPWVFDAYPEFSLFDAAVLSFEVGAIKPHPEIYQHAVDTYQLTPETTFYIDDLTENIATGHKFGFHCHQYDLRDHAAFDAWMSSHSF